MENNKYLLYGTRNTKKTEKLRQKLIECISQEIVNQRKLTNQKRCFNVLIVTRHETQETIEALAMLKNDSINIFIHKFDFNPKLPFTTEAKKQSCIDCHFFLDIKSTCEALHRKENTELKDCDIFIDDALIDSFEAFMEKLPSRLNVNYLMVTMDPIINILMKKLWTKSNIEYLVDKYALKRENLNNTEIKDLRRYIDEMVLSSGFNKFNNYNCEIKTLKYFCNIPASSDKVKKYVHEKLDVLNSIERFDVVKEVNYDLIENGAFEHVVFCIPSSLLNNIKDLFGYYYCFITKKTSNFTIVCIEKEEKHLESKFNTYQEIDDEFDTIIQNAGTLREVEKNLEKYLFVNKLSKEEKTVVDYMDKVLDRNTELNVSEFCNKFLNMNKGNKEEIMNSVSKRSLEAPTELEIKAFLHIKYNEVNEFINLLENDELIRTEARVEGDVMLGAAIFMDRFEIAEYLVTKKNVAKNFLDRFGRNPVQLTTLVSNRKHILNLLIDNRFSGYSQTLGILIKQNPSDTDMEGIDLSLVDEFGSTPLHYIAAMGREDILERLNLEGYSLFDVKDKTDFTCFDRAACGGHLKTLELLLKKSNTLLEYPNVRLNSIIEKALGGCNLNIIEWFFQNVRSIPDHVVNSESCLLHKIGVYARSNKKEFIIPILDYFQEDADFKKLDEAGNTILMKISESYYCPLTIELIDYLLEKGLDLSKRNVYKRNLMHNLAEKGNLKIFKYLHGKGVPMNKIDKNGDTPFIIASKSGFIDLVEFILGENNEGAILEHDNNLKLNALDAALIEGHNNIAKMLIDKGIQTQLWKFSSGVTQESYRLSFKKYFPYPQLVSVRVESFSTPGCLIYLVRGLDRENEREAWHYIDISPWQLPEFVERTSNHVIESVDLSNYGKILFSGWSKNPEAKVIQKLEKLIDEREHSNKIISSINKLNRFLIEKTELSKFKDGLGANILHLSAAYGRLDVIIWLMLNKFDIDSKDNFGNTALCYAALNNQIEAVTLLKLFGLNELFKGEFRFLSSHVQQYAINLPSDLSANVFLHQLLKAVKIVNKINVSIEDVDEMKNVLLKCMSENEDELKPHVTPLQSTTTTALSEIHTMPYDKLPFGIPPENDEN